MSRYDVLFFHHIPRSGGNSIKAVLKEWFHLVEDYRPNPHENKPLSEYLSHGVNTETLPINSCISGHFSRNDDHLQVRYPDVWNDKRYKIISFVRSPLSTRISIYYFEKQNGYNQDLSLEEYLTRPFRKINYIAKKFSCTENNFQSVLDRYFFIGILEAAQESIDKLSFMLNKPRKTINQLHESEKESQHLIVERPVVEEFKKNNQLDYLVYNYCLKKFMCNSH